MLYCSVSANPQNSLFSILWIKKPDDVRGQLTELGKGEEGIQTLVVSLGPELLTHFNLIARFWQFNAFNGVMCVKALM